MPTPTTTRKISIVRVLIVAIVSMAMLGGSAVWAFNTVADTFSATATLRFAPYVDVTLTPVFHFEDPLTNQASETVLSFVVADTNDGCEPSWGTYYSLDAAGRALDLDRRIVSYREQGGDVIVSFGGQANSELATTCEDVDDLVDAYTSVIDEYDLKTVDFDIEGAALTDTVANDRRSEAIARVQEATDVAVWLTLPVSTSGLTAEGVAVVDSTLAAGVDLAGVNAMTMNLNVADSGISMAEGAISALEGVRSQLDGAYQRAGIVLPPDDVWDRVGATPMPGQNDIAGDVFTLSDASAVTDYASSVGLGMLSMWSLHRDGPCGAVAPGGQVSNTCSGVDQEPHAFASIFLTAADTPAPVTDVTTLRNTETRDDPATSPYPIWRETRAYEQGEKVVWRSGVYESKWWTEGDLPDEPAEQLWDTPWRYLGPVLAADAEIIDATRNSVDGDWPEWSADDVYIEGDEVQIEDQVFRASWWTQGDQPQEDPDRAFDHPWEYVADIVNDDAASIP